MQLGAIEGCGNGVRGESGVHCIHRRDTLTAAFRGGSGTTVRFRFRRQVE